MLKFREKVPPKNKPQDSASGNNAADISKEELAKRAEVKTKELEGEASKAEGELTNAVTVDGDEVVQQSHLLDIISTLNKIIEKQSKSQQESLDLLGKLSEQMTQQQELTTSLKAEVASLSAQVAEMKRSLDDVVTQALIADVKKMDVAGHEDKSAKEEGKSHSYLSFLSGPRK